MIREALRLPVRRGGLAAAVLLAAGLVAAPAQALDVLGFYVGGGVGQAQVRAGDASFSASSFRENHTAWKAVAGVRPISLLGAELAYMDFGSPTDTVAGQRTTVDLKATAIYGMFYLPIPAPLVDIYAKGGYARLNGEVRVTSPSSFRFSADDDDFTAGAGVQVKLGSWALRGEYERFMVSGSDPSLVSLSVTKTFF